MKNQKNRLIDSFKNQKLDSKSLDKIGGSPLSYVTDYFNDIDGNGSNGVFTVISDRGTILLHLHNKDSGC